MEELCRIIVRKSSIQLSYRADLLPQVPHMLRQLADHLEKVSADNRHSLKNKKQEK
jgi:hypothetical protein